MVINISCKFEKSTYNTLASSGVMRKYLHTEAAAYLCIIHSIHWMLSSRYKKWNHVYCSYLADGLKIINIYTFEKCLKLLKYMSNKAKPRIQLFKQ